MVTGSLECCDAGALFKEKLIVLQRAIFTIITFDLFCFNFCCRKLLYTHYALAHLTHTYVELHVPYTRIYTCQNRRGSNLNE